MPDLRFCRRQRRSEENSNLLHNNSIHDSHRIQPRRNWTPPAQAPDPYPKQLSTCTRGPPWVAEGSRCVLENGIAAFEVKCVGGPSPGLYFDEGQCGEAETCLDSADPAIEDSEQFQDLLGFAYCISIVDYIGMVQLSGSNLLWGLTAPLDPATAQSGGTIEAMLLSLDNTTSVLAQSLSISAQRYVMLGNGSEDWQTLDDEVNACNNCSTLRLGPISKATARVEVDVMVPTNAFLYLYTAPQP